jgi:hypothetical protein
MTLTLQQEHLNFRQAGKWHTSCIILGLENNSWIVWSTFFIESLLLLIKCKHHAYFIIISSTVHIILKKTESNSNPRHVYYIWKLKSSMSQLHVIHSWSCENWSHELQFEVMSAYFTPTILKLSTTKSITILFITSLLTYNSTVTFVCLQTEVSALYTSVLISTVAAVCG